MTVAESGLERRRGAIRGSILDLAREEIAEHGHEGFSMRKLAEKAGYTPGALYLYFKTREDLLRELVEEAFEKLLDVLNEVHDVDDPARSLKNKLRAYVEFGLRFPNHYHFAFVSRRPGGAVAEPHRPHASYDVLRDAVRRCIEEQRPAWPDVETTSQILWVTIHGITSLLIARPTFPWIERDRLIEQVLDTAIRGLGRPASSRRTEGT